MTAKRLAAHALLWGGLAAMIGGLYMLAGTGWASLVGGFMVYAVGYDLIRKRHERETVKAALVAHLQGGQTAGESFTASVREMQRQRHN
jgi:hypothetical protein